jgi:hypothetical protein
VGSPLERFLTQQDDAQLNSSVAQGTQQNADRAARVIRLQMRTGLDSSLIDRNLEQIEAQAKRADFNPSTFRQGAPGVASWLQENPHRASVAAPDLTKLSYLERQVRYIRDQFMDGVRTVQLQDIGERAMTGTATDADRARQRQIESQMSKADQNYGITGFFEGIPGAVANQLPVLGKTLVGKAEAAAVGAGGGALAGAATGALAGAPTGPGEAATIPAGAIAGASVGGRIGWRWGSAIATGRMQAALAYLDYERLTDSQGRPLDRATALGAAMITGVVSGLVDAVGVEAIMKTVPGLRALGRSELREALRSQTARQAIGRYAKGIGEAMIAGGGAGFIQQIVKDAAGQIAQLGQGGELANASTGQILDTIFSPQNLESAAHAAKLGAAAGVGITAATGGASLAIDVQRARRAHQTAQALANIGDAVAQTGLVQKLPEATQNLITRLTRDTPAEKVYAPVDTWNEYWQSKGVDPAKMAEEITGSRDGYDEAVRTGGDVPIDLAAYATKLGPTEHHQFFVNELRADPLEMNAREAEEAVKSLDAKEQETALGRTDEASVMQVQSQVAQQLLQAGFDHETAATYSELYGGSFRALARRAGLDPVELFNYFGLKISRNEAAVSGQPRPEELEQQALNLDQRIGELRQQLPEVKAKEMDPHTQFLHDYMLRKTPLEQWSDLDVERVRKASEDQLKRMGLNDTQIHDLMLREERKGLGGYIKSLFKVGKKAYDAPALEYHASVVRRLEIEQQLRRIGPLTGEFEQANPDRPIGARELQQSPFAAFYRRPDQNRLTFEGRTLTVDELEREWTEATFDQPKSEMDRKMALWKIAEFGGWKEARRAAREMLKSEDEDEVDMGRDLLSGLRRVNSESVKVEPPQEGAKPDYTRIQPVKLVPNRRLMDLNDPLNAGFESDFGHPGEKMHEIRAMMTRNVKPGERPFRVTFMRWGGAGGIEMLGHADALTPGDALQQAMRMGFVPEGDPASAGLRFDEGKPKTFAQEGLPPELTRALQQSGEQQPRGRIRIGKNEINIELLKDADLSTFIHETGHFYREVLRDLASGKTAPEGLKADHVIIEEWLSTETSERAKHEKFARGFEAFLMEGKAPSSALGRAFARFRAWLVSIYRDARSLNVELTPEVRGVFDRLLATDEEIDAAQHQQAMEPLFGDPQAAGMNEREAAEYQDAVIGARQAAADELAKKVLKEYQRESSKVWQAERARIETEVGDAADQDPTLRARSLLERGQLPSGAELPAGMDPIKLSRTSVDAYWGKEIRTELGRMVSRNGGLHPDVAAGLLGFNSGDALIEALRGSPDPREWIRRTTDARLDEARGGAEALTPEELPAEAMKAVHNEKRARLLQMELQRLATHDLPALKGLVRRVARRLPPLEEVRRNAEDIVSRKKVRDVNPLLYQRAEVQAGRAALEALLRGDVGLAFDEKQRELLNHELYRAAADARDEVESVVSLMRKFDQPRVRARIGKAGADYLAQIDALRGRFEFARGVSLKELSRRESLRSFLEEQQKHGSPVNMPENLKEEAYRTNYKDLLVSDLRDVGDAVTQLEKLAQLKNRLLVSARSRRFDEARQEMISGIQETHVIKPEPIDLAPGLRKRLKRGVKGMVAVHTKPEFLFEWLDGNREQGPLWSYLFKPFISAENEEHVIMRSTAKQLTDIFNAYDRSERATWWWHKTEFEGLGALTKANILAIALNQGNEYNKEALLRGYGWTDEQVSRALDTLTLKDWQTVQKVWDLLERFWPRISELQKRMTGLEPEKVEATPVVTKHGTFRGGYYPIVFDGKLSWRQGVYDAKAAVQEMFGGQWARAQTRQGHVQAREDTGGKPLKLELTGLTQHISNVVHDLTHREAVYDVSRLIHDPEIRAAIEGSVGREMYRQLNPWLLNIANARRADFANPIEGLFNRARTGATVVNMGWKATTAVAQFLSYTNTIKEIGVKYASLGLKDTYAEPWKIKSQYDYVTTRSEFMRDRLATYDRDVNDALKRLNVAGTKPGPLSAVDAYTVGLRDSWFKFIGWMDMGASLPTWLGAYRKAMDGEVEGLPKFTEQPAIDYADKVVRQTQGVGAAKDLATIQSTGGEVFRLFTMFYSYFNVLFNQFAKSTHQFRLDKNAPRYVAALTMLWFAPAVLQEMVVGRGPNPDDDQDKWLKWFAKTELSYPFQTVVLLRDIVNGMEHQGYEPSAGFAMFDALTKSGQAVAARVGGDKDELTRADLKNMAQAGGYVTKLPSKQLWLTGEYLYDWLTGEEQPDNPAEALWRAVVTGKKKEQ